MKESVMWMSNLCWGNGKVGESQKEISQIP
jgi:hypothetical protein